MNIEKRQKPFQRGEQRKRETERKRERETERKRVRAECN